MSPSPLEKEGPLRLDFGTFMLDPRSGEITSDGAPVRLAALPSRLLRYLVANRSRTVSKAELTAELWPGLRVEESSLQQAVRAARKAVGDDGRRQQVVATVAGVGYRFVAEPRDEHGDRSSFVRGDYVGQRELTGRLNEAVEGVRDGEPQLLLLSGDPGVGKSRAVEELTRVAWNAGLAIVRGGGNAPEGASAFGPWIEAFRELSGVRPVDSLRAGAPLLLGIEATGATPRSEPDRYRVVATALRCLEASARLGPLAVILEDVHQSGLATLELLEFILNELAQVPLLLVATYRDLELGARPELHEALSRLLANTRTRQTRIEPLTEVETAYLVEQRSGLVIPASEIPEIARSTGSIPFFALELAAHLRDERASNEQDALRSWIERNAGKALSDRISQLDPAIRSVLEVAAVCGTSFDPRVVARASDRPSIHHEIRVAIRERLLNEQEEGKSSARFAHALVRDALYTELAHRSRDCQALHLRVAEALVEIRSDSDIEAAYHLCVAAPLAGATRVAEGVERAARRAAAGGDFETALSLYGRVIEALDRMRARAPSVRLRMLVAAGELGVRGASVARPPARARLDEAIAALRHRGDSELFARAALARTYRTEIVGTADAPTLDLLAEAIEKLEGEHPALIAQLRSRRAIESRYTQGGEDGAQVAIEMAIREARRSSDAGALARVLEDASLVRWSVPDPEAWRRLNEEIVDAATRANDTELVFQGVKGLVTAHLELGDRNGFEREVARCASIADDYPSPFLKAVVTCFAGTHCLLEGDFGGAEQKAILAASSGLESITPLAAGQLFYHRRELGRLEEIEGTVRQFIQESPGIAMWPIALALSLADSGRHEEAREVLAGIQPIDDIAKDRNWLPTLIVLAESAVILEDHTLCERVERALRPYASVNVVLGNGSLYLGQTAHYLGTLALVLERWQDARDDLEQASIMHANMRSDPWRLRTAAEQAHLARLRGDRSRARKLAKNVAARARTIGMIRCAERAEAAL